MKTAKELFEAKYQKHFIAMDHNTLVLSNGDIHFLINEARKDAIEEVAARTHTNDNKLQPIITKEKILLILNELK